MISACLPSQMHGQAIDFRLPRDYGEAGAFGGPPEPALPADQPGGAAGLPPAGAFQCTYGHSRIARMSGCI